MPGHQRKFRLRAFVATPMPTSSCPGTTCPYWRDFPEFWEYGAQWDQHLCSDGFVFKDKENCLAIYSDKHDPTQEKTCREIARFSEKDAETWRKIWALEQSDEYQRVQMDMLFNPAEFRMTPEILTRQAEVYPEARRSRHGTGRDDPRGQRLRVAQEWFESPELQSCILRFAVSSVVDITEPGQGGMIVGMATTLPTIGFNRGGTHMVAHAAHQLLTQMGCEFFINKHVEKVIIENGTATGIRLVGRFRDRREQTRGEYGLTPEQLLFDLIGREHVDDKTGQTRRAPGKDLRLPDVVQLCRS